MALAPDYGHDTWIFKLEALCSVVYSCFLVGLAMEAANHQDWHWTACTAVLVGVCLSLGMAWLLASEHAPALTKHAWSARHCFAALLLLSLSPLAPVWQTLDHWHPFLERLFRRALGDVQVLNAATRRAIIPFDEAPRTYATDIARFRVVVDTTCFVHILHAPSFLRMRRTDELAHWPVAAVAAFFLGFCVVIHRLFHAPLN